MADYQQLSRIARSNFFPSGEIQWKSTTKITYCDQRVSYGYHESRKASQKDWLSQWGEKETCYRKTMKKLEEKQQEQRKKELAKRSAEPQNLKKDESRRRRGNIDKVNASVKKESIKKGNIRESQSRSSSGDQSIQNQPVKHEDSRGSASDVKVDKITKFETSKETSDGLIDKKDKNETVQVHHLDNTSKASNMDQNIFIHGDTGKDYITDCTTVDQSKETQNTDNLDNDTADKNTDCSTKEEQIAEINNDISVNPEIAENLTKLHTNEEIKNITIIDTDISAVKTDKVIKHSDRNIGSDVTNHADSTTYSAENSSKDTNGEIEKVSVGSGKYTTVNDEVHTDVKNTKKFKDSNITDVHVNENTAVSAHLRELEGDS